MTVRLKHGLAGSGGAFPPGSLYSADDAEERRLVDAGIAETLSDDPGVPETAAIQPPEAAVMPKGRIRKAATRG